MKLRDPIYVTRSSLPPLEEYTEYLRQIWASNRLTNNGPLLQKLEAGLRQHLSVDNILVVNNCMSALLIALESGEVAGEVITTPFSYVATSTAIIWQKNTPVFADIRRHDLTIDPDQVELAITPNTRAILATHVYGLPCDVDRLADIAKRHNLLLIYDAAHAFGCSYRGRSLASYGDISCLSFHATKVFHTVEGGAIVVNKPEPRLLERARYMRSFGHLGDDYRLPGINAKCSELHAAMGLCNLPRVPEIIAARKQVCRLYDRALAGLDILKLDFSAPGLIHNGAYYPVFFPNEETLLHAQAALNKAGIYPRRYFWPALNELPFVRQAVCPLARVAAATVLCLPVSPEVSADVVEAVTRNIKSALAGSGRCPNPGSTSNPRAR